MKIIINPGCLEQIIFSEVEFHLADNGWLQIENDIGTYFFNLANIKGYGIEETEE